MKKTIKSFIILIGTLAMISCVMPSTDEIVETMELAEQDNRGEPNE